MPNKTNAPKKPKTKPSKRRTRLPIEIVAPATPDKTYVNVGRTLGGEDHGAFWGDAAVVQNLPSVDRAGLARHLVALAGNVVSTVGDDLDGATIVVLTRRKASAR